MIVAITAKIGNADVGNPNNCKINISDIVPPPIGTAVINKVARIDVIIIVDKLVFVWNK